MSSELYQQEDGDFEAVNDDSWSPSTRPRKGEPCARRRVEALLEERCLARLLKDDWPYDDEEE
ncbi:PA3496 family putative envelope integrity protein [Kushneria aurantia]|uniref:PA3496 family putative envelope integrity protein n=1 Tax=Kushneria aurantia TaxID=504092 RepID=A0ABV6FZM5_9GAMM|nr:hypothetical protein [Kushneria aurantia]